MDRTPHQIDSTEINLNFSNNLNNNSIATEDQHIIQNEKEEHKNTGLRTSKFYDLDKFKNDQTLSEMIQSGCNVLKNKSRKLKSSSFYSKYFLKKVPFISVLMSYSIKSFLLPDFLSGLTGIYCIVFEYFYYLFYNFYLSWNNEYTSRDGLFLISHFATSLWIVNFQIFILSILIYIKI